ncbi:hypothetical protein [Streptomyces sp. NPDC006335]|uniref:hypothetical protein n=1 Tax=Streptomyces sp. NPDC006335 TaxID=3156895 RepID=UPI0033B6E533
MPWYLWMLLGAVVYVGVSYYLIESATAIRPKSPETCSWCSSASGHTVTGHSYATCRGPVDARVAEERRRADQQFKREHRDEDARKAAQAKAAELARHAGKMRMLQIGTITTRTGPRGNEIHVSGWAFDTLPGPHTGPSKGTSQPYSGTGAPEEVHGWTLRELHAIAHGGACRCDVVRLTRNARR